MHNNNNSTKIYTVHTNHTENLDEKNNKNKTRIKHDGLVETYLFDDAYLLRVQHIIAPFRFGLGFESGFRFGKASMLCVFLSFSLSDIKISFIVEISSIQIEYKIAIL